jgi:hypothetical protein
MATPEELASAAKLAENQERLNRELEKYNELQEKALELGLRMTDIDSQKSDNQTAALNKEQEIIAAKKKVLDLEKELISSNELFSDELKIQIIAQQQLVLAAGEELKVLNKKKNVIDGLAKAQKEYGKEVKKNLEDAKEAANSLGTIFEEFAGDLPVVGNSISKLLQQKGNLVKMGEKMVGASKGMKGVSASMTKGVGEFLKGASKAGLAAVVFVGYLAKLGLEFDDLSKSIGKATGFGNDFAGTLTEGYKQTMSSGVEMREYADSVTSLANSFSGFNPTAEKTNVYLANTTSQLTKLGVSADSSAKLMDHFHRAMGVSQEAAADMTAQLVLMGKQVGITASKMASDFQASAGRLAIYGKNNFKVFKQLAAQVKATGLEMGTLIGISKQFDQFDTAANSAAQLNAVLGTQLSTLEMMNATDAERIKMMKEQVQASVGNFDSLDKFTKMHIAQAMGLKDVDEAQRLLNMSQAEASKYAQEQKESADIQAELAERTKELVPLMQKLKIAFMKFVMAFSPVIQAFTWLIEKLAIGIDMIAEFAAIVGPTVLLVVSFYKAVVAFGAAAGTVATPVGWVVMGLIALVAVLHQMFDLFGAKINPLFVNIFSHLAVGLLMMKDPLDIVLKGMSKLGSAFAYVFGEVKKEKADLTGGFDIQAIADIDTSKVATGINEIKSAVMELAGVKMDGFLAMHTDGSSSSFIMGSDGLIKSISEGKLIVDVKMPEMKIPDVLVKVFLDGEELRSVVSGHVNEKMTR